MQYADLQSAVAGFLNSSAANVAAMIPTAIALAEAQMNRRLRVRRMTAQASLTIAAEYVDLPDDFAGAISLALPDRRVLECLAPDAMAWRQQWVAGSGGEPGAYAVVGGQFQVSPVPAGAYAASLIYYQKIPPLSDDNPTNWVLADHPDAYLYGALVQMGTFLISSSLSTWVELYTAALGDIAAADAEVYGARLTPMPAVRV